MKNSIVPAVVTDAQVECSVEKRIHEILLAVLTDYVITADYSSCKMIAVFDHQ